MTEKELRSIHDALDEVSELLRLSDSQSDIILAIRALVERELLPYDLRDLRASVENLYQRLIDLKVNGR